MAILVPGHKLADTEGYLLLLININITLHTSTSITRLTLWVEYGEYKFITAIPKQ